MGVVLEIKLVLCAGDILGNRLLFVYVGHDRSPGPRGFAGLTIPVHGMKVSKLWFLMINSAGAER